MLTYSGIQSLPPELKQALAAYLTNDKLRTKENAMRLNQLLAPYGVTVPEPNDHTALKKLFDIAVTAGLIAAGVGGAKWAVGALRGSKAVEAGGGLLNAAKGAISKSWLLRKIFGVGAATKAAETGFGISG